MIDADYHLRRGMSAPPSRSAHLHAFRKRAMKKARRQRKVANYRKKRQDFFKSLPSEITFNILLRLSIPENMRCKCVCKPWLNLLERRSDEILKFHFSKSALVLGTFHSGSRPKSKPYEVVEFLDEGDPNCDDERKVFNFDIPFRVLSSANGLLFLSNLSLCNPITREYIKLPPPPQPSSVLASRKEVYGFGVSRVSGQYKVVRYFLDINLQIPPQFKCVQHVWQVYTVGTGFWRRVPSGSIPLRYEGDSDNVGVFLNGNLHWLASKGGSSKISCFDLETELFSSFFSPPRHHPRKHRVMSVLGDCLCVCDNWGYYELQSDNEIDIWLMKEYGDENSWTKQFIIRKDHINEHIGALRPIKVFKDGDVLMELEWTRMLYYSSRSETIREVDLYGWNGYSFERCTIMYAPSFLSLRIFAMENVSSF